MDLSRHKGAIINIIPKTQDNFVSAELNERNESSNDQYSTDSVVQVARYLYFSVAFAISLN